MHKDTSLPPTYICPEKSSLLLFSAEAINLDGVTGAQGADSTLHRWVTGHEQTLGPIRASVTNMEVPPVVLVKKCDRDMLSA